MKKIMAVFPTEREENVKGELYKLDIGGMLITHLIGLGLPRGSDKKEKKYYEQPKTKLEIIVTDPACDIAVEILMKCLHTGKIGDGKIFISHVEDAIRIRTGERGPIAV
ncbi:MAG: transcriptional regulator [Elusimicrobia bacterium CG06_land_8_20_14_3_00_38_11]|nr:MAG: transcriptional regulator [Elusimicrobia bacterium CG06_land_8_20_14_3_00_38_11]